MEHGYPTPIIDLKLAADNTKALFKNLNTSSAAQGINY
jgi:hypothetical protein